MVDFCESVNVYVENENWIALSNILDPKHFLCEKEKVSFRALTKVAELLTLPELKLPIDIETKLLKCLSNSCINGHQQKRYIFNPETKTNCTNIYSFLLKEDLSGSNLTNKEDIYPTQTHFSYDYAAVCFINKIVNYFEQENERSLETEEILKLRIGFLCNLFACACDTSLNNISEELVQSLNDENFKNIMIKCTGHSNEFVARYACGYVHNMLKRFPHNFYTDAHKQELSVQLIKSVKLDIYPAIEAYVFLVQQPNYLKDTYDNLSIDEKLYLLEATLQVASTVIYNEENISSAGWLPPDAVEFLSYKFKSQSDLILKTKDSYLNNLEPREVTTLLELLSVLTSTSSAESKILQADRSLLINCIYLLKSIHMAGKASENNFTPIQKLSDLSPQAHSNCNNKDEKCTVDHVCDNIQAHPAFAFKANLIRIIGNLVHQNKENQNFYREEGEIPLLLDCCNLDARNPLIMQWAIFAIRNLCQDNMEVQMEIARSTPLGTVEAPVLREMGLTLNEDEKGNPIGIMQLPRSK